MTGMHVAGDCALCWGSAVAGHGLWIDPLHRCRAVSATAGGGRPSTPGDMGGVSEVVESVLSDVSEVMEEGEEGAEVAIVTAMDSGIDIEEHSTPLFR